MTTDDENANAVGNQRDVHTGKRKDYGSYYTARQKDNKVLKNGTGDVSQADLDKQKAAKLIIWDEASMAKRQAVE
ncbi:hypothetical protein Tco_1151413, partial [Tanacetum coccineum]